MSVPQASNNGSHGRDPQSPQALAVNEPTAAIRDAEHATWLAALDLWRDEIDRWQEEHGAAVSRLRALQQAVEDHGRCLVDHLASFQRVVDAVADHERFLAAEAEGTAGEAGEALADRHQRCGTLFNQLQDAQQRIARHHNAFMSHMQALEKAAAAAL